MTYNLRDPEVLKTLRPQQLSYYLTRMGWTRAPQSNGKASFWTNGSEHAVMVPLKDFDDYSNRIAELLEALRRFEKRPSATIFGEIVQSGSDVLSVRVIRSDEKDGTIPLNAAPKIFRGAGQLLTYAGASAVSALPVHDVLPAQAEELRRQARFGQTEHGSYVVNVFVPLPAQHQLFPDTSPQGLQVERFSRAGEVVEPFSRRAMRVLMTVLSEIDSAETPSSVISQVQHGVSAQLCKSLAQASGGIKGLQRLEVSAKWSPAFPLRGNAPERASFAKAQVQVIRQAGKVLGEVQAQPNIAISGHVIRLERETEPDSPMEGIITVRASTVPGGPLKNLTMAVDAQSHLKAIQAYRDRRRVTCIGDLLERPITPYVYRVRDFDFE